MDYSDKIAETIFENTHFMIAFLDKNFNFIRVNKAYANASNENPKYFVGKNHFQLYPNKENEEIFKNAVENGEPYSAYAKPFEHPVLGLTYWDWNLQPLKDENGNVEYLILSLINVTPYKFDEERFQRDQRKELEKLVKEHTEELKIEVEERKKAEKELRQARDNLQEKVEERTSEIEEAYTALKENETRLKYVVSELERSNEELQSFAYITSHDLQEPLRTVASYAGLIEMRYKGKLDSDADEFLEYMIEAAKRMKKMIQGLLDYSRVGTRGSEFVKTDMNVNLEKAISNLKSSIDKSNAEITHDFLPNVAADPNQMVRMFQNLISNAIKFKKPETPLNIHISAKLDIEKYEHVFSVSDNGIGMEEQYTDKIFEVFKRLHTIDKYGGTGIGLAVVKRIIDRHGGHIWVESKLGVGSVFYFTIPSKGQNKN